VPAQPRMLSLRASFAAAPQPPCSIASSRQSQHPQSRGAIPAPPRCSCVALELALGQPRARQSPAIDTGAGFTATRTSVPASCTLERTERLEPCIAHPDREGTVNASRWQRAPMLRTFATNPPRHLNPPTGVGRTPPAPQLRPRAALQLHQDAADHVSRGSTPRSTRARSIVCATSRSCS
jgi:hypothetical protein